MLRINIFSRTLSDSIDAVPTQSVGTRSIASAPKLGYVIMFIFTLLLAACSGNNGNNNGTNPPVAAAQEGATSTPIPTAPAAARPTYTVQRGDVTDSFSFTGRWQARDQMALSFEINGTVRRVNVRPGDAITAGQLLADYEITDLENQLASAELSLETALANLTTGASGEVQSVEDAEIQLANAKLSLESTKANSPWTSVASAEIQLENAEIALENAQRAYDEAISHPERDPSGATSAYDQLVNAQQSLRSAQISYSSSAQSFNNYQFQIAQSENSVIQAQLALDRARSGQSDPDGQEAVRSAQLNVDQINASIARSSLYAPIDGVVLEVSIQPGDQAEAFATVITIGIPEPKEIIATLAINDAQRLSPGMIGTCQAASRPETKVQCVVRRIPTSSQDADQTTRIAAGLENIADSQLIEVEMPLEVAANVLWLPPAAIRTFQNRTFVVLETADGPRSVDVVLGLQTDDRVEIVSGVNEGDVVVAP